MMARVLIIASDGFEEVELFGPLERLRSAGLEVALASPTRAPIQATVRDDPGRTIRPDLTIADARESDFDALLVPGGLINPDRLRQDPAAVALVRSFAESGKPVAAICHGPWLLVEADVVRGRRVTGWPSIRTDLANAGGFLSGEDRVVRDTNVLTAVGPDDVPAFADALIEMLRESRRP